jgi:YNFM family putative membrane transporter
MNGFDIPRLDGVTTINPTAAPGAPTEPGAARAPERLRAGTPAMHRLQIAMTAAGLAAFAMLYSTQALLPSIGSAFGIGATEASLTISVTTGIVGLTVLPMSAFAERYGRTRVMSVALGIACVAVALGGACTNFPELVISRAVVGLALAGVVAVAMGHIGDEVEPAAAAPAIGIYVSGTSVGGLLGRLVPAAVEDSGGWRWSLVALGLVGAICAATFVRLVPPARPQDPGRPRPGISAAGPHLRDAGIVRLCLAGLLAMGGFVAVYNYLTFRLAAAPFGLSKAAVGLIFIAYLAGTVVSTLAGQLSRRIGRRRVMLASIAVALAGLALTLPDSMLSIIVGLVIFTSGFFGCHATASAWVTTRARANKSHASALYLTAYYLGSSIGGTTIGLAWSAGGWAATAAAVACCYLLAGACALGVRERG